MMRLSTTRGKKSFGDAFRHRNIAAMLLYGISALVVLLLQNAPSLFPAVGYARPIPLVVYVVCVGVLEGAKAGAVIGALSGVLWGLYAFRLFGFDALVLMAIGLVVGLLVEWFMRANFLSAMLLCGAAILAQLLIDWLCHYVIFYDSAAFSILWRAYLPNGLYTMLLAPLMYFAVLLLARSLRRK